MDKVLYTPTPAIRVSAELASSGLRRYVRGYVEPVEFQSMNDVSDSTVGAKSYNETVIAHECFPGCTDSTLAVCGKRNVGCACMSSVQGPLSLAVAYDEYSRRRHRLFFLSV